jgi:Domain of unknown function (DUF4419)
MDGKMLYYPKFTGYHSESLYDGFDLELVGADTPASKVKPDFVPFDASHYHSVDANNLPPSRASVPVNILTDWGTIECVMVAGLIGMKVKSSGKELHGRSGETGLDTISIEPGWWMEEKGT